MIPSGNLLQFAVENDAVEIVSFPINSMVIFQIYVADYQRVHVVNGISWVFMVISMRNI